MIIPIHKLQRDSKPGIEFCVDSIPMFAPVGKQPGFVVIEVDRRNPSLKFEQISGRGLPRLSLTSADNSVRSCYWWPMSKTDCFSLCFDGHLYFDMQVVPYVVRLGDFARRVLGAKSDSGLYDVLL